MSWRCFLKVKLRNKKAKKAVQSRELAGCDPDTAFQRLEMQLGLPVQRRFDKVYDSLDHHCVEHVEHLNVFCSGDFFLNWVHWVNPHLCVVYVVSPLIHCKVSIHGITEPPCRMRRA